MTNNYIQTSYSEVNAITQEKFYSFKSECACFDHDLKICLERNDDPSMINVIQVTFYDKVWIGEDFEIIDKSLFKRILFRIKLAWKCFVNGGFEVEHGFVFKDVEHLKQFQQYFNERANEILKKDNTQNKYKRTGKSYRKKYRKSNKGNKIQ
jgi:hypothetical protein